MRLLFNICETAAFLFVFETFFLAHFKLAFTTHCREEKKDEACMVRTCGMCVFFVTVTNYCAIPVG